MKSIVRANEEIKWYQVGFMGFSSNLIMMHDKNYALKKKKKVAK